MPERVVVPAEISKESAAAREAGRTGSCDGSGLREQAASGARRRPGSQPKRYAHAANLLIDAIDALGLDGDRGGGARRPARSLERQACPFKIVAEIAHSAEFGRAWLPGLTGLGAGMRRVPAGGEREGVVVVTPAKVEALQAPRPDGHEAAQGHAE